MLQEKIKILAIESSCDETAATVISGDGKNQPMILSNVISSQVDLHAKTGGVVPEVASRAHMEAIIPVITEALIQARRNQESGIRNQDQSANNCGDLDSQFPILNSMYPEAITYLKNEITHIAVTAGPGLAGSLMVGFNAAKALAYALDKPIIPVNHIEGHIYSALASKGERRKAKGESSFPLSTFHFPLLALVVSGGHSSLILMKDHGEYEVIGETLDDAAGEAFDKVAKLLGLGYPGGPAVSKLASEHRANQESGIRNQEEARKGSENRNSSFPLPNSGITFPRPLLNDGTYNFSFSGLKTAVLREVKSRGELTENDRAEIATAFEDAAVDVLVQKTLNALTEHKPNTLVLAGGVAANSLLRKELELGIRNHESGTKLLVPPINLCGDNAVMIGLAACHHIMRNGQVAWDQIKVDANWEIG